METPTAIALKKLEGRSPEALLQHVRIEATHGRTGYDYGFSFVFDHPESQYIKIDTQERKIFLDQGSEKQAQQALVTLAQGVRQLSGGSFNIHPFHGAVWGTKIDPVSPGFLTTSPRLDDTLSMIIYLTDAKDKFDERFTKEALAIGTVVAFPGPKAARLMAYQQAPKTNPNQSSRDQAITNNLGARWDEAFRRYNSLPVPSALTLNPRNIVVLMSGVAKAAPLTNLALTGVYSK